MLLSEPKIAAQHRLMNHKIPNWPLSGCWSAAANEDVFPVLPTFCGLLVQPRLADDSTGPAASLFWFPAPSDQEEGGIGW